MKSEKSRKRDQGESLKDKKTKRKHKKEHSPKHEESSASSESSDGRSMSEEETSEEENRVSKKAKRSSKKKQSKKRNNSSSERSSHSPSPVKRKKVKKVASRHYSKDSDSSEDENHTGGSTRMPKKKRKPLKSPSPTRIRKVYSKSPNRDTSKSPSRKKKNSPSRERKKRQSRSPRMKSKSPIKEKPSKKGESATKVKKSKQEKSLDNSAQHQRKKESRSRSKEKYSKRSYSADRKKKRKSVSQSDSGSESPVRKEKVKPKKKKASTPEKKDNRKPRDRSTDRGRSRNRSRSVERKRMKKSRSKSKSPVSSNKSKERSKASSPKLDVKRKYKKERSSSPVSKKSKERRSESPKEESSKKSSLKKGVESNFNQVSFEKHQGTDEEQTEKDEISKTSVTRRNTSKSEKKYKKEIEETKMDQVDVKIEVEDNYVERACLKSNSDVQTEKLGTGTDNDKKSCDKEKNLIHLSAALTDTPIKVEPCQTDKKDETTNIVKTEEDEILESNSTSEVQNVKIKNLNDENSDNSSNKTKDQKLVTAADGTGPNKVKESSDKILMRDRIKQEVIHIKKEIKSREERKVKEMKSDKDIKARSEKDSHRRMKDSHREASRDYHRESSRDSNRESTRDSNRESSRDSNRKKEESKYKREKSPDKKKELIGIEEEMKKRKDRIEAWRNARKQKDVKNGISEQEDKENKNWSLENDDDDEEIQKEDQNKDTKQHQDNTIKEDDSDEDEDLDPLDAYMKAINKEVNKDKSGGGKGPKKPADKGKAKTVTVVKTVVRKAEEIKLKPEVMEQNQDALEYSSEDEKPADITANDFTDITKRKKDLQAADHSMIYYAPFRKDFYIEVPELSRMTLDEVKLYRESLGDIQVRGKNIPKPIKSWSQAGLNSKIMNVLKRCNYEKPTPIQAQAIPTVMSGRDMIGIAKTGSGKTLAFVLPLLRHCIDQPALDEDDGPIAIMMTPTRELALQIYRETRKFCKPLKLSVACIYGGSGISEQIAELKKGAEVIVCTPGRMIDMLAANNGKVTNCRRCTYLVLDEADRMFDMGFEPQVMRIIDNIRPDRQTVLFSATFPRQMEAVARKVLKKPVEIQVGGRSVVCSDIEQHALVIDADNKFFKLLELLGIYHEQGSCLVFVEKQETADVVFKDLLKKGYPCLSLHGGMDQFDRDSTIADFKNGVMKIMVSTSVAARGLDVKNLILVINFDCPNHYEDYVHRVGRTGRAGNKGFAYTLLTYDQGRNAGDIVKAFEQSKREPPPDILALWNGFKEQMEKEGKKVKTNSGFSGKGFKFNADEDAQVNDAKKMQKFSLGLQDSDDEAEVVENAFDKIEADLEKAFSNKPKVALAPEVVEAQKVNSQMLKETGQNIDKIKLSKASNIAALLNRKLVSGQVVDRNTVATAHIMSGGSLESLTGVGLAKQLADKVNAKLNYKAGVFEKEKDETKEPVNVRYEEEIDINDFPQQARWRITSKEIIEQVREISEAGITVRGVYVPPNKKVSEEEKRLHLYIESLNERSIQVAKAEIKRLLKEELIKAESNSYRPQTTGRYKVV